MSATATSPTTAAAPGIAPPAGQPANGTPKPAEVAPPTPSEVKLIKKLKLGGKETEVDMAHPDTLRELQIARANADKRAIYETELKTWNETKAKLAAGDLSPLEAEGLDWSKLLAQAAERKAQLDALSPEQQEIVKLRQELEQRGNEQKKLQAEREAELKARQKTQLRERTKGELMAAMKASGLPLTTEAQRGQALKLAATIQARAITAGQPPLNHEQLGLAMEREVWGQKGDGLDVMLSNPAVRTRRAAEIQRFREASLQGLEGEALVKAFPPETLKRILTATLATMRGGQAAQPPSEAPIDLDKPPPPGQYLSEWDIRKKWGI